jgi:Flp pilus assembly protein TadB
VARRYPHPEHPTFDPSDASSRPWETRIQIVIAVALGLAAVVTAAAVYRNEQEDHNADKDFHAATSYLVSAVDAGIASPRGRKLEALAERAEHDAEDHQERATHYTLAEVILAVSLFLFGIAGVSSLWIIKIGALSTATVVFAVAVVVLAAF